MFPSVKLSHDAEPQQVIRRKKNKGVTTVEYAIMLVLVAIAVAVAAPNISSAIVSVFGKTSSVLGK